MLYHCRQKIKSALFFSFFKEIALSALTFMADCDTILYIYVAHGEEVAVNPQYTDFDLIERTKEYGNDTA